jgi:hypothetical protein
LEKDGHNQENDGYALEIFGLLYVPIVFSLGWLKKKMLDGLTGSSAVYFIKRVGRKRNG